MNIEAIQNSDDILEKIDFGVRLGAARALAEHKREGRPIAVWQDDKVVMIPPEEIQIPAEFADLV